MNERWGVPRGRLAFWDLALTLMLAATTCSAVELLHAEINTVATLSRVSGPMWIEVKLTSKSTRLREGALEFTQHVSEQQQWTYTTQDLALVGGTQTYRFLLPPSQTHEAEDRSLHVRFIEKGAASDLGSFPLSSRSRPGKAVTLAIGPNSARGIGELPPTWVNFRLEHFAPERVSRGMPTVATGAAVLDPGDFPTDALGYCAFDAVLLEGADFVRLKQKALDALGEWLTAGGALLVTADVSLDSAHCAALQTWIAKDTKAPPLQFGPDGRLIEPSSGFSLARVGFGRLAVTPSRPSARNDYATEPWRRSIAWLWKLRSAQAEAIVRTGALQSGAGIQGDIYERNLLMPGMIHNLTQSLLPKTVRVIPRNVIISLLGAFLFIIGPVDWWLLGKFRARRFTWLLFPVVTAGVTVAMMKLARHYLGRSNQRGALVITDLAPDGRVARETRLEVLLPAERGSFTFEGKRSFCVPVQQNRTATGDRFTAGVSFHGNFPYSYTLTRPVQQWSPIITRQTRIGGGEDDSRVKWHEFHPEHLRPELVRSAGRLSAARALSGDSGCNMAFTVASGIVTVDPQLVEHNLLQALTIIGSNDRSYLFSPLSPSGSDTLYDLACLESDEYQSTIVIATRREGPDLHVWRRLYLY
jgi:hypothetical protein